MDDAPPDPGPTDDDATRWSRIAAGDYDYLVRRYWQAVHRYLSRHLRSADDADELTQDVFLAFLERDLLTRPKKERGPFRRFVFHVARQFLIDRYRAGAVRDRVGPRVSLEAYGGEVAGKEEEPEVVFDRVWYLSLFGRARQAVREHYEKHERPEAYQVFKLFYYGDEGPDRLTHQEIADRLDLTADAVRNIVHRSKKQFIKAVQGEVATYAGTGEAFDAEIADLARFLDEHRVHDLPSSDFLGKG